VREVVASWPDGVLLRRKEAAAYLNVRHQLLEEWAVFGSGPPYIKNGRWVRYRLGDIRAWENRHMRTPVTRRKVIRR
jgi:hypothetical protein